MRDALPFVVEGAQARLDPGRAPRSLAAGPGLLGRAGAAGTVLWRAAAMDGLDLLALFWTEEADGIDWLDGFLCDQGVTDWFAALAQPPEEEEEPEEMFSRQSMNTLEGDLQDDAGR